MLFYETCFTNWRHLPLWWFYYIENTALTIYLVNTEEHTIHPCVKLLQIDLYWFWIAKYGQFDFFMYPSVVKSLMCIGINPNEFYYPKQQWYVAQSSGATYRPCSACGECQGSLSTTKGCCPRVAVCSCCSRCYVFRGFKERLVFCVLTRWRAARARAPHQYQPVAWPWHTVGLNGKNPAKN